MCELVFDRDRQPLWYLYDKEFPELGWYGEYKLQYYELVDDYRNKLYWDESINVFGQRKCTKTTVLIKGAEDISPWYPIHDFKKHIPEEVKKDMLKRLKWDLAIQWDLPHYLTLLFLLFVIAFSIVYCIGVLHTKDAFDILVITCCIVVGTTVAALIFCNKP